MSKHTPGPWSFKSKNALSKRIVNTDGYPIADTFDGNAEANARLIASSPELAAEVKTLIEVIERGTETPEDLEGILAYAKEVLAKALNESPDSFNNTNTIKGSRIAKATGASRSQED